MKRISSWAETENLQHIVSTLFPLPVGLVTETVCCRFSFLSQLESWLKVNSKGPLKLLLEPPVQAATEKRISKEAAWSSSGNLRLKKIKTNIKNQIFNFVFISYGHFPSRNGSNSRIVTQKPLYLRSWVWPISSRKMAISTEERNDIICSTFWCIKKIYDNFENALLCKPD